LSKQLLRGTALAVVILLSGCATPSPNTVVLSPVGPVSSARTGPFGEQTGSLRVFSATEHRVEGGIDYYPHTPYLIYSPEGKRVRGVQHHIGSADQRPMTVPLPPGRYVVYARAEGHGRVTVPVFIVASRMTLVYLEGKGLPEAEELPAAEVVRLPDGRAAGRRAPEPVQQKTK
jgi:hypothetical protein